MSFQGAYDRSVAARTNAPTDVARSASIPAPAPTATTAGVLRPDEFARHVELVRTPADPSVDRWVENHWSLRWDLPAGRHFSSQVVAHPTVSLTAELGSHRRAEVTGLGPLVVTGVATKRFDVDVAGWGRVLGVRFRPGGLAALTGKSATPWTDRSLAAGEVLPPGLCEVLADPEMIADPGEWRTVAETGIARMAAESDDHGYDAIMEIVADMLADRTLVTVADVARRHGRSVRTLQRGFAHYVGVGPKWVLARYRMHDAISDLDAGYDGTLADLAHRSGWYDQAHFNRDFAALVGVTPGDYLARQQLAAE